ncbi:MAG: hydrolase, partial [SAR324 cluster bacterium]|nr:hydrolase [SAR324 cluster bacterium]
MPTRLVLFDIDGTLLTTNGRAVQAMLAALREAYGVTGAWDDQDMNGKSVLWIVHKLLADMG